MGERLQPSPRVLLTEQAAESVLPHSFGELLFRLAMHGGDAVVNSVKAFLAPSGPIEKVTIATADFLDSPSKL